MLRTPTGGAGHGTATADDRPMSIGTVLLQLRDEFPEVTISKIRFLEAEGLIEPQRTPPAIASSVGPTWSGSLRCYVCSGTTTSR